MTQRGEEGGGPACGGVVCGGGKEWRRVALMVPSSEAGPSRAPPRWPERTAKGADYRLGIMIPEKLHAGVIVPLGTSRAYLKLSALLTT